MEPARIYMILVDGTFAILTIINSFLRLSQVISTYRLLLLRYLVYPVFLHRHYVLGPWSRFGLLLRLSYLAVNVFFGLFKVTTISEAQLRTGTLSLINLLPLYLGTHFGFLADLVGVSIGSFRAIHASSGLMATLLGGTHIALSVANHVNSNLQSARQTCGLIVGTAIVMETYANIGQAGISLTVLLVLSLSLFRRPSYEIFLRGHQTLAVAILYSLWRHTMGGTNISRLCVYSLLSTLASTSALEICHCFYRNFAIGQPCPRAHLTKVNGAVTITLSVPRPWTIKAGQYVNVWIPSVGFWQSHPFMIAGWTEGQMPSLLLIVEPREGLTRKLVSYAADSELEPLASQYRLAFFSGPHGLRVPMGDYGNVLLIASGFGIAAQIPYVKELIRDYHRCKVRTRRIHLVWQLHDFNDRLVALDFLNEALREDARQDAYILRISIFYRSGTADSHDFPGMHARVFITGGVINVQEVLKAEIAGSYAKYVDGNIKQYTGREWNSMLVAVSASNDLRDEVRTQVRRSTRINQRIWYFAHDYQPSRQTRFWDFIHRRIYSGPSRNLYVHNSN